MEKTIEDRSQILWLHFCRLLILSSFISSCASHRPEIDFECECFRRRVASSLALFVCLLFLILSPVLLLFFFWSNLCCGRSTIARAFLELSISLELWGLGPLSKEIWSCAWLRKPRLENAILCRITSVNSQSSGNQKSSHVRYMKVLTFTLD